MVSAAALLAPVFVQVALTLGLLFWAGRVRVAAVRSGAVRTRDIALREANWPRETQQLTNAYQSQVELPVLFHLVIVLALVTAQASALLLALAWIFVATRLLHALVHVTTNNVPRRFILFLAGTCTLAAMWVLFAVDLYFLA